MSKTFYVNVDGITEVQSAIMVYVHTWVRTVKTPIPQKEIVIEMSKSGVKDFTTVNALYTLVRKGYIRRAYNNTNTTTYVQLRSL